MMKKLRWILIVVAIGAINSQFALRSHGGLFKMDFGTTRNLTEDGVPAGNSHENGMPVDIPDWDEFPTFCLGDDIPACYDVNDPELQLFPVFPEGVATWPLKDYSNSGDNDVVLTITDNVPLGEEFGVPSLGMIHNNPVPQELDVTYDGVAVPAAVKDDYLYRNPDTAGTEMLFRWSNLNPGKYNVTMFMGRTNDNGQFAKVWVDDINGAKEPDEENTGDFAGSVFNEDEGVREETPEGNPKTVTVDIKGGDYLWYAHMEDNQGGISGIIVRQVSTVTPGDFDGNGVLDAKDIDDLSAAVRARNNPPAFDLTGDARVDDADRARWISQLRKTWIGDSDLNGEFNTTDFVAIFTIGEYEDTIAGNSGWADGDWTGDGEFNSADFVAAFTEGGYEKGPRPATAAVPEPSALILFAIGALAIGRRRK